MKDIENSQFTSNSTSSTITIILVFVLVHGLLFAFDVVNNSSLLSGDRSTTRNATIAYVFNVGKIGENKSDLDISQSLHSTTNLGDRILSSGHAGDYLIQGSILALSNRHVLVVLQLALALFSTLCVFALLTHLRFSVPTATLSTLLYMLLPGSLLQAHQLSTEALCIPSIVIACYLLVVSSEKKGIDIAFVAGLLALSVAIFVRPQLILFPFLLLIIYCRFSVKKLNTLLLTVIPLSLFFSAVWMVFVIFNNGHFSLGGADRSIGRSFHDTAEQMAMSGDFEFDSNAYKSRIMPFSDFSEIVGDHTSSYLRQRTRSMINFAVNSGAYSLAIRHLEYFDINENSNYWQHLRAQAGFNENVVQILKRGTGFIVLIIGSTLAWCLVLVSAIAGLSALIKDKNAKKFTKILLLSLVSYQAVVVMLLSVGGRWQHRSLVDFIIVILAMYGLKTFQQHLNLKKAISVKKVSTVS